MEREKVCAAEIWCEVYEKNWEILPTTRPRKSTSYWIKYWVEEIKRARKIWKVIRTPKGLQEGKVMEKRIEKIYAARRYCCGGKAL